MTRLLLLISLFFSGLAQAGWELDSGESRLNFVSTKKGHIAEVHQFTRMHGSVSANQAVLTIELDSVDTKIGIRDQRMREFLFETGLYPTATVSTVVDVTEAESMPVGASSTAHTEVILNLHGQSQTLPVQLGIVRLAADRMLVYSKTPVIVKAQRFGLTEGIAKLMELAGLPSISHAVPVSFSLTFQRK